MKQTIAFLLAILFFGSAVAQVDIDAARKKQQAMINQFNNSSKDKQNAYDERQRKAEAEYAAFRKKANDEYAAFMEKAWKTMNVNPPQPKPKEPAPPKPQPKPQTNVLPPNNPLPKPEVKKPEKTTPPETPPIPPSKPETPTTQVSLYGTQCAMHATTNEVAFRLSSIDNASCTNAWKLLSQSKYDGLLHDCLAQRDKLNLGDWAYLQLLKSVSERFLGKSTNEAVLLQMYLFVQSGYKARLGRQNGKLVMMVPFNCDIYSYFYVVLDGLKYFILSPVREGGTDICDLKFPKEHMLSIAMNRLPQFNDNPQPKRTFTASSFGTLSASVGVNKGLIDFLNNYPLSNAWDAYARAGLSDRVKADLYPVLRSQISGKSQRKAAMMLLNFLHTAFDYATDQEQFGYERPLFGDESFYYPKNDCEDRSILFAILVRDLMGLDVALVHWPGHLATAVCFTEDVSGDYFTVGNKRFIVCDPTYIGADPGMTMPQFKNANAELLVL